MTEQGDAGDVFPDTGRKVLRDDPTPEPVDRRTEPEIMVIAPPDLGRVGTAVVTDRRS